MTRASPSDIITELNSNWDTDLGGTKPSFINEFEGEEITDINQIGVNWGDISWVEEARVKDTETNTFLVQIVADSIANLNTKLDHTRNLIKAKTLAGGHYMMTSASPIKASNYYIFFATVEEVTYAQ